MSKGRFVLILLAIVLLSGSIAFHGLCDRYTFYKDGSVVYREDKLTGKVEVYASSKWMEFYGSDGWKSLE